MVAIADYVRMASRPPSAEMCRTILREHHRRPDSHGTMHSLSEEMFTQILIKRLPLYYFL